MNFLGEDEAVDEGPTDQVDNSPESDDAAPKGGVSCLICVSCF